MKNVEIKVEKISVVLLHSGLAYQRKVTDMDRVKNIAENWDDKLFNYPCVSFRNGIYNVIDGQNTIMAYKMRFGENIKILCRVVSDLTKEEEDKWFYDLATSSIPQTLKTKYNARLLFKDPPLLKLISDLKSAGLTMQIDIPSGNSVVSALEKIEKIHNGMDRIDFITCFKILHDTWDGDNNSLKATFLNGMVKFYNTYKDEFDEQRFIKALSTVCPKSIKAKADTDVYMKNHAIRYARIFVEQYNFNLRKLTPLKISKLED